MKKSASADSWSRGTGFNGGGGIGGSRVSALWKGGRGPVDSTPWFTTAWLRSWGRFPHDIDQPRILDQCGGPWPGHGLAFCAKDEGNCILIKGAAETICFQAWRPNALVDMKRGCAGFAPSFQSIARFIEILVLIRRPAAPAVVCEP